MFRKHFKNKGFQWKWRQNKYVEMSELNELNIEIRAKSSYVITFKRSFIISNCSNMQCRVDDFSDDRVNKGQTISHNRIFDKLIFTIYKIIDKNSFCVQKYISINILAKESLLRCF